MSFVILAVALFTARLNYSIIGALPQDQAQRCYDLSFGQATDSVLQYLEETAGTGVTRNEPFVMLIQLVKYFSAYGPAGDGDYLTIREILERERGNVQSCIIAICVIMQKWGWDIQYLHNKSEHYLGINFEDGWAIRRGHWVEIDGFRYYLKVFDSHTPVGELTVDEPLLTYQALQSADARLKPLSMVNRLPEFDGIVYERRLNWHYGNALFGLTVDIPEEQVEWTLNLPSSLFGMVASGTVELDRLGLIERLRSMVSEFDEYERVNFLLKFCQSEDIFTYDSTQPVVSVSRQFFGLRNDCDGRSVLLYCLLRTVLQYPSSHIIFVEWPYHIALALKPLTEKSAQLLALKGVSVGDNYYILDPSYVGDTSWGSSIEFPGGECRLIYP
jgi:hypothetical protein